MLKLCAFADEASPKFSEQILALKKHSIPYIELRGLDGKSVSSLTLDEAKEYAKELSEAGIRVEIDRSSNTIGYKIRSAQTEKVPYMLVIGAKEIESGMVAVRSRKYADLGTMTFDAFLSKILVENATKSKDN